MKHLRTLLFTMILAALTLPVSAGSYGTLTGAELKGMLDRNEPGLVIIDSRSQGQYDEAHIKGAICIPLYVLEQNPALPLVPKDATVVFYCSGTG